ncbi:uncharacterized protein Z519_01231 [Cladophialophora bantiana CBS 173.52]|uniref:Uncharacterized protein n=1 Tax=Cladophialophora bantiana (strain ATCC 10958 / CBS 173.52 / CDC B-1940 / NIH 8579) TaxID=1442370 RepID=A0A0D2GH11_CLAB1|nr:uncharacterized protein Z519_01231 [Cladophialophora bantiana CBS 173.52]KIW97647.1 hypothetical protein Z519_01231 [Cladophialophora bantiana CBS 173.52]
MSTLEVSTILLLARKGSVLEQAPSQLLQAASAASDESFSSPSPTYPDLRVYTGSSVADVRSAFDQASAEAHAIQHVFVGAGLELENRLEIVREVITLSASVCVHLKDATSGPHGFVPFVKAVLGGMRDGRQLGSTSVPAR